MSSSSSPGRSRQTSVAKPLTTAVKPSSIATRSDIGSRAGERNSDQPADDADHGEHGRHRRPRDRRRVRRGVALVVVGQSGAERVETVQQGRFLGVGRPGLAGRAGQPDPGRPGRLRVVQRGRRTRTPVGVAPLAVPGHDVVVHRRREPVVDRALAGAAGLRLGRLGGQVEAGHDLGPGRVHVDRVGLRPGRGRLCGGGVARRDLLGQAAHVVARGRDVDAVDVQPVGRPAGQRAGPGDRVQVGRRAQVGRDAVQPEHVEQVLADARVDVADGGVLGRHQTVVAPTVPGVTRAHLGHLLAGTLPEPDCCIVTGQTVLGQRPDLLRPGPSRLSA